jgi:hypothetical protein
MNNQQQSFTGSNAPTCSALAACVGILQSMEDQSGKRKYCVCGKTLTLNDWLDLADKEIGEMVETENQIIAMVAGLDQIRNIARRSQTQTSSIVKIAMIVESILPNANGEARADNAAPLPPATL